MTMSTMLGVCGLCPVSQSRVEESKHVFLKISLRGACISLCQELGWAPPRKKVRVFDMESFRNFHKKVCRDRCEEPQIASVVVIQLMDALAEDVPWFTGFNNPR